MIPHPCPASSCFGAGPPVRNSIIARSQKDNAAITIICITMVDGANINYLLNGQVTQP